MIIWEVGKSINPLLIEDLAKILWDITYLCWNRTNILQPDRLLDSVHGNKTADQRKNSNPEPLNGFVLFDFGFV